MKRLENLYNYKDFSDINEKLHIKIPEFNNNKIIWNKKDFNSKEDLLDYIQKDIENIEKNMKDIDDKIILKETKKVLKELKSKKKKLT